MTDGIPSVKARTLTKALEKGGFYIHHQTGSHIAMRHNEDKTKRVTVPRHSKELKKELWQTS